jgi:cysteinyl-tRNA synthetase
MSIKYLGESFDLHTGGVDNIFPHHENEIAQSEAATGRPFVRYWMHACHLMVDGEKMAKSKGNFYTLRDLVGRGHDPRAIRMLLLSTHYRTPLNFTVAGLAQAAAEVRRLEDFSARIDAAAPPAGRDEEFERRVDRASVEFRESLEDDLNISGALGAVFRLVRDGHAALDRGELPEGTRAHLRAAVDRMDGVLAVVRGPSEELEPEIVELVGARTAARARRDFAESDRIRDRLLDLGVVVEDTPDGVRVKRKLR